MPYEALQNALDNPIPTPARRWFGTVEYVFIPVNVVEAVLADAADGYDDEDLDEIDYDDEDANQDYESEVPTEDDVLATIDPVDEDTLDPPVTIPVGEQEQFDAADAESEEE